MYGTDFFTLLVYDGPPFFLHQLVPDGKHPHCLVQTNNQQKQQVNLVNKLNSLWSAGGRIQAEKGEKQYIEKCQCHEYLCIPNHFR